jgi:hypothetical protein
MNNQIHNFMSSSGSGSVINYGSGSGSDFLTSYSSGSGSGSTTLISALLDPDPDPATQINAEAGPGGEGDGVRLRRADALQQAPGRRLHPAPVQGGQAHDSPGHVSVQCSGNPSPPPPPH